MDDVIKEFLIESYENLDRLERDLVALEQQPGDKETLARIFRTFHTVKGTSGFLGYGQLESLTHVGESLLSRMRDGALGLTPEITSTLLALGDAVRGILACIENVGDEGDADHAALHAKLVRLEHDQPAPSVAAAAPSLARVATPTPGVCSEAPSIDEVARDAASAEAAPAPATATHTRAAVSDTTIRVDVALLDRLMNLVGELVLARNQVLQFTTAQKDSAFLATSQRLNLITTELQEGVMKTRMQPIGSLWSKLPRLVRDLSLQCGKQVRIELDGSDTELDKTIIEAIKDPLTHLVRNAVDHGVEAPEVRRALGKPAEGRLSLRAYHEGGQVNIEISDDGGGIDGAACARKAAERGLITAEQAACMSERDRLALIFHPGFSTAAAVTNVSGRGVGMDVVKTNIERIGGTVDVHSALGQGTTLKLRIPLTLAIVPALTVSVGRERYAIAQTSLVELVRVGKDPLPGRPRVELIHGAPVFRLRGRLLPLVYLARHLAGQPSSLAPGEHLSRETAHIVVLQADERQFGLVVNDVHDTEEIVVKPLGRKLKSVPVFAGATIMGDGRVALILDVRGLAQQARLVSEVHEPRRDETRSGEREEAPRTPVLLVVVGAEARMAIPLASVTRLEEFARARVERSDGQEMVQYRGDLLPLVYVSEVLGVPPGEARDPLQVVVFSDGGRSVGLVVERIEDIIEEALTIEHRRGSRGRLGTAVIRQRITDVLDVPAVLRLAAPWIFPAERAA